MNEAVKFLKDCGTFFIATVDGDQPRVRPFGAVVEYRGKAYFCTGSQKEFYKQSVKNPKTEICACAQGGQWIRISGEIEYTTNLEVKQQFFTESPGLARIYEKPENPVFSVFSLKDGKATFYSYTSAPKTISV